MLVHIWLRKQKHESKKTIEQDTKRRKKLEPKKKVTETKVSSGVYFPY